MKTILLLLALSLNHLSASAESLTVACGPNASQALRNIDAGNNPAQALSSLPVWLHIESMSFPPTGVGSGSIKTNGSWGARYTDSVKQINYRFTSQSNGDHLSYAFESKKLKLTASYGYDLLVFDWTSECEQGGKTRAYVSNSYTHGGPAPILGITKDCLCLKTPKK